jgi:hypothetical protein
VLKLLLDEHISPGVASGLRRRNPSLVVYPLVELEGGAFLGQPDDICLEEAARKSLTLVTYDRRTIPPLLKAWTEEGRRHGGVIFIDERTIAPADIGALVRALTTLARETRNWSWPDRIIFLRR